MCTCSSAYVHVHARTVHVMDMNEHVCSRGMVRERALPRGSAYLHVHARTMHVHARTVHVMHMIGHVRSKGMVPEEPCHRWRVGPYLPPPP